MEFSIKLIKIFEKFYIRVILILAKKFVELKRLKLRKSSGILARFARRLRLYFIVEIFFLTRRSLKKFSRITPCSLDIDPFAFRFTDIRGTATRTVPVMSVPI